MFKNDKFEATGETKQHAGRLPRKGHPVSGTAEAFVRAKKRVLKTALDPIIELMQTANAAVAEAEERAVRAVTSMEVLRPVWAQGWTDDGVAAQASATALAEIWHALGVENQTEALERINAMLAACEKGGDA